MSSLCVLLPAAIPVERRWRPFCSERCKLQDLARWADGTYRVPAEAAGGEDGSEEHENKRTTQNEVTDYLTWSGLRRSHPVSRPTLP